MNEASIAVDKILSHHGVKGMKWGKRKASSSAPTAVSLKEGRTVVRGKTKVKATGGTNRPAHADARNALVVKQVLKKSGTVALSNQELRDLSARINLEQSATRLTMSTQHPAKKWIKGLLKSEGKKAADEVARQQATKAVNGMMKDKKK